MAKVLVTGGAGFIGSHLCDALISSGDDVIVIDDFSTGTEANLASLAGRVELIRDSVLNLEAYHNRLVEVERIYHLAALISGYESLQHPRSYLDTNLRGLLQVVEVARANSARIIFASSSTIYGDRADGLCRETYLPRPKTVYALTKLAGEHLLDLYSRMYNFTHVSLRLFNVFGPRQSPDHPYANVTCKFSLAAALGKPIQLFGSGHQSRDFIFIDDAVNAFLVVSQNSKESVYNVGTGVATEILELIGNLEEIAGTSIRVRQMPPWPNDIQTIRADVSRLSSEFGIRPATLVRTGLARTVEEFRLKCDTTA